MMVSKSRLKLACSQLALCRIARVQESMTASHFSLLAVMIHTHGDCQCARPAISNEWTGKFNQWQKSDLPSGSKEQGSPSTALLMADRLPESCRSSCKLLAAAIWAGKACLGSKRLMAMMPAMHQQSI